MNAALHQQVVEACERLLEVDHSEHEDLIRFLQEAAAPYSVPFLREAVRLKPQLEYLEYDDYGAYYKKCLWALAAIGTAEARAVIEELAQAEDPVLREEAAYRLSKFEESRAWAAERRGKSSPPAADHDLAG